MNPFIRHGEVNQQYLGDGVYVAFDGYQLWLRAERDGQVHEVALEPPVFEALQRYVDNLKRGHPFVVAP